MRDYAVDAGSIRDAENYIILKEALEDKDGLVITVFDKDYGSLCSIKMTGKVSVFASHSGVSLVGSSVFEFTPFEIKKVREGLLVSCYYGKVSIRWG